MLNILLDTDALVALTKKTDSNRQKAISIYKSLKENGVQFFLSPYTTAETVTVLSYRLSHKEAKKFLQEARKTSLPVLSLEDDTPDLADQWFFKQNKKGTSYFDCYNMALLERYGKQLNAIFSFDSVYKRNGFKTAEEII
ncbi:PIN domain-containing protein [Candidatus Curtissbacteria bacterium]|nr:PIN domain-containing protein [Candidatus Curtissbacteria bacterium]